MQIRIKPNTFFVFDLDDTLFPEIEFLRSGFRVIATKLAPLIGSDIYPYMWQQYSSGANVFQYILQQYSASLPGITIETLLSQYREHVPDIQLNTDAAALLQRLSALSIPAGLITDGRSITQRNKLKALQLESYFSDVIISEEFGSEKPDERNYRYFDDKYPGHEFYYFGDNTTKDFTAPASLGWYTACLLDNGTHIHAQSFTGRPLPSCLITSFDEIQFI
jgi:putative hydrolase of the HAD superfamily